MAKLSQIDEILVLRDDVMVPFCNSDGGAYPDEMEQTWWVIRH